MKRERRDTDNSASGSAVGGKVHSIKSGSTHKKGILLENTYKTEPDEGKSFSAPKVRDVATKTLESILKDKPYDPKTIPSLSKMVADKVKEKVKELNMPRHKIITHVVIGQAGDQSIKIASRCLWNHKFDSYQSAQCETKELFAIVTVYGIYFE